jgi:hypothetical protein
MLIKEEADSDAAITRRQREWLVLVHALVGYLFS